MISDSKLGLVFSNGSSLFHQYQVIDIKHDSYDKYWELPWGEVKTIRNNYNQLVLSLKKMHTDESTDIIFRAYDDGIAFRYHVKKIGSSTNGLVISNEITQFNLSQDADVWWTPAYGENRYEELYRQSKVSEMDTAHTPLTLRYDNGIHLSIHEASLANYSSMQLFQTNTKELNCDLAPWSNGDKVRTVAPFISPWRTIKIADSAKDLITNYLTLNCNEPNKLGNTSWIKPSKYIGIWWGMIIGKWTWEESFRHGATTERGLKYIDFAAKHGFDEVLIEGWAADFEGLFPKDSVIVSFTKTTPDFDLDKVQNYAKSKGVFLQAYQETMGNTKNYLAQIDSAFSLLNQLGIRNAKIGHVGNLLDKKEYHYGQYGVEYFRKVLEKAAEYRIGVNFHEPIKDTGERRTYPNMLTREGARGMEYNAWSGGNPPNHTTILPFTRLLNSPMDFTPGIFDLLYENLDFDVSVEFPITFTVMDSGNGYQNLMYKSSESFWEKTPMIPDTIISGNRTIYKWELDQDLQVGEWEWGVTADHPAKNDYEIWIPHKLSDRSNRKIRVEQDGSIIGQKQIFIPSQSLDINKDDENFYKKNSIDDAQRVRTTLAKQLALYVVIHSPLQMASDFIDNYDGKSAFQFIKDVPVDWDSTVVLNGEIGQYITIARKDRNSRDWYIGSITNEIQRSFKINLSFLDDGKYQATIYSDGKIANWESDPFDIEISQQYLSKKDRVIMKLAEGGGQAIKLKYIYE